MRCAGSKHFEPLGTWSGKKPQLAEDSSLADALDAVQGRSSKSAGKQPATPAKDTLAVFASWSDFFGRFAARDDRFEVVIAQVHVTMVDSDAGTVQERLQVQSHCAQAEEVVMSCG